MSIASLRKLETQYEKEHTNLYQEVWDLREYKTIEELQNKINDVRITLNKDVEYGCFNLELINKVTNGLSDFQDISSLDMMLGIKIVRIMK